MGNSAINHLINFNDENITKIKKYRVGIAGYGVVGKRRHEYLMKHPKVDVVSVCDQNFVPRCTFK